MAFFYDQLKTTRNDYFYIILVEVGGMGVGGGWHRSSFLDYLEQALLFKFILCPISPEQLLFEVTPSSTNSQWVRNSKRKIAPPPIILFDQ